VVEGADGATHALSINPDVLVLRKVSLEEDLITSSLESANETHQSTQAAKVRLIDRHWQKFVVPLASMTLLGCFAVMQLSRWPNRLRYPGEEDAAEGTQLSEMVHLRRGIPIYRAPSNGDFDSAIYGPLCYLLGAAVVNPQHPAYLPLRLLSLSAVVGLGVLSGLFVFHLTGSGWGAMLAPMLLFGNAYVARYGVSARADMVALLLSFAGFYVFFRQRESRRALMLAAGLMLLSFFYKQQFIGAPASVFLYLLIIKRFRAAAEFAACIGIGGLLLSGVFSRLIFPDQPFLTHFLAYNHLPFNKELLLPEILMFVVPLFVPLLGSADFLDSQEDRLIKTYAILATAGYFLLLFSSGSGADTNRCLEAVVVLNCLMAARIASARSVLGGMAWTTSLVLTLTLVTLLNSAFVVPKVQAEDFRDDAAVQKYLRENFAPDTPILTYYAADPLRAGLAAPITNLWHYSALLRTGMISDRDIVARIQSGGYGAILLDFDLDTSTVEKQGDFYTTPAIRIAILSNYREQAQLIQPTPELTRFSSGKIHVWAPRQSKRGARE